MRGLVSLLLAAALCGHASAWWCTGHMLTVAIAYRNVSSDVRSQLDKWSGYFANEYPDSPDFVQSACWPDDIKEDHLSIFSDMHFTNTPVIREPVRAAIAGLTHEKDVVWALATNEA